MNSRKCLRCGLVNFATDESCRRCGTPLTRAGQAIREGQGTGETRQRSFIKRVAAVLGATCFLLFLCYISLLVTSDPVTFEQRQTVYKAIDVLEQKGFGQEAFVLRNLVSYRATDSWWNRWVGHHEAYAATNFPFEVVTLYTEFFDDAVDDVERAAILLHESYHLYGAGEPAALEGAWRDKRKIGWTVDKYGQTKVWSNTRELTMSQVPLLFKCGYDSQTDCYQ